RLDFRKRQSRVERGQNLAYGWSYPRMNAGRANDQSSERRNLRERKIDARFLYAIHVFVHHAGDDANDLRWSRLRVAEPQLPAHHVRAFQVSRGEGLVHQDDARRLSVVPRVEEPSFAQLRADSGEISGRGDATFGTRFLALFEGWLAQDLKNAPVVAANHRQHVDPARGGHAGQAFDALYQLLEEIAALLLFGIFVARQPQIHRHNVIRFDAQIGAQNLDEAAHAHPRANHQDRRDGKLRYNQPIAQ